MQADICCECYDQGSGGFFGSGNKRVLLYDGNVPLSEAAWSCPSGRWACF